MQDRRRSSFKAWVNRVVVMCRIIGRVMTESYCIHCIYCMNYMIKLTSSSTFAWHLEVFQASGPNGTGRGQYELICRLRAERPIGLTGPLRLPGLRTLYLRHSHGISTDRQREREMGTRRSSVVTRAIVQHRILLLYPASGCLNMSCVHYWLDFADEQSFRAHSSPSTPK